MIKRIIYPSDPTETVFCLRDADQLLAKGWKMIKQSSVGNWVTPEVDRYSVVFLKSP